MGQRPEPASRAAWRAWLSGNHGRAAPVRLVIREGGASDLNAAAASEEALCLGWIDSLPHRLDEGRWMLLVSPRRRGSRWSRLNKARVAALRAVGQMTDAGEARIAAALADGSWDSYEAAESLKGSPDLAAMLAATPRAAASWRGFAPSARKGILWWIASARTAPTQANRVAETARLAALGLRANVPESRGR